jgi:hypothetical protein
MEIRKPHTFLREFVDIGRADLAAVAAYVGEAQIIGDDDKEVWAFDWSHPWCCLGGVWGNEAGVLNPPS